MGLFAGFAHEFGVFRYFAANEISQTGDNVGSNVACPDGVAARNTERFDNLVAGDLFLGRVEHFATPICLCSFRNNRPRDC